MKVIANKLKLKPPPLHTFIREWDGIQQSYYVDDENLKEIAKLLGLTYSSSGVASWVRVEKHCKPHRDDNGKCLVILARGHGELYVKSKTNLDYVPMYPGMAVVFNDRLEHFWLSDIASTMLVMSVK